MSKSKDAEASGRKKNDSTKYQVSDSSFMYLDCNACRLWTESTLKTSFKQML